LSRLLTSVPRDGARVKAIGVDYDARCKKWRARLTRKGRVFHLGYFTTKDAAILKRRECEEKHDRGEKFDYLHSYTTPSVRNGTEGDFYLTSTSPPVVHDDPERNLRLAVLVQAVKDFLSKPGSRHQLDAKNWLENESFGYGFSFIDIADALSLDPEAILASLREALLDRKSYLRMIGRRLVRTNEEPLT
jgi:hypothetical protein